jgi:hypothetical protein
LPGVQEEDGEAPQGHELEALRGQIWAGISWQNVFLPVTHAFDESVEFVSPFYDLEMIRCNRSGLGLGGAVENMGGVGE